MGLEERLASKVGLLSGGQRQALTLLMATINPPTLLLLDEHTAALDPKTAAKVMEVSNQLIQENNTTTFITKRELKINRGKRIVFAFYCRAGIYRVLLEEKRRKDARDNA